SVKPGKVVAALALQAKLAKDPTTDAYLAQELAVSGQVGRSDRRHDPLRLIFVSTRRRPRRRWHSRLSPARRRECGHDVLAELVGDQVHGRAAAVPIVHTVEGLPPETEKPKLNLHVLYGRRLVFEQKTCLLLAPCMLTIYFFKKTPILITMLPFDQEVLCSNKLLN